MAKFSTLDFLIDADLLIVTVKPKIFNLYPALFWWAICEKVRRNLN